MSPIQRNQLVVGVIAAIAVIIGLHFMIFRPRAEEYRSKKAGFDEIVGRMATTGSARSFPEIYRFQYQTLNYQLEYYDLLKQLDLTIPDPFFKEFNPERQRADLIAEFRKLEALRDEGNQGKNPRLTFLSGPRSWDVRTSLPPQIAARGIDVGDWVRKISDVNDLIKALPSDSPLLPGKKEEYRRNLLELGLDLNFRDQLAISNGPVAALLYTVNRVDLVRKALSKDFFGPVSEKEYDERLYILMRMDWPKSLHVQYRQVQSLLDIIARARERGVEEILSVKMWDIRELRPPESKPVAGGDDGGPQYSQGTPAPDAAPTDALYGGSAPIELTVRAPNAATMGFFYELSHAERPYEVDSLDFISPPQAENQIYARAVIGVLISTTSSPPMSPADLQAKIREAMVKKIELAGKGGSKELAMKENFDPVKAQAALPPEATPVPAATPAAAVPAP